VKTLPNKAWSGSGLDKNNYRAQKSTKIPWDARSLTTPILANFMPPSPTNRSPVANLAKSTDLLADFLQLRGSEAAGIDKVVSPHRIRHSAITTYQGCQ
jgi:hypothetical protein